MSDQTRIEVANLAAAFQDWFRQSGVEFWRECDAPEELAAIAVGEVERLRAGIRAFLEGDYDSPRLYQPGGCPHGTPFYEGCSACDCAHFERLLANEE
ncbi:hypothetical protein [Roseomonas chloroacetimidivorans]|jgi:hypothetical protein|uniref:hypothetical protein n=1 Tax=Roseomonas chloroacetimidivorans TaxID=1766656 RepID=UPI003C7128F7